MKKYLFHLITILVIGQSAMSGCSLFSPAAHQANQKARAQLYYVQHPNELASECAAEFPVAPGKIDTGKPVTRIDTATSIHAGTFFRIISPGQLVNYLRTGKEADTVICKTDTVLKTIRTTVRQTDTLHFEDTAAKDSLQSTVNGLNAQMAQQKQAVIDANSTADTRLWIIIGVSFVALVLLVAFISKLF